MNRTQERLRDEKNIIFVSGNGFWDLDLTSKSLKGKSFSIIFRVDSRNPKRRCTNNTSCFNKDTRNHKTGRRRSTQYRFGLCDEGSKSREDSKRRILLPLPFPSLPLLLGLGFEIFFLVSLPFSSLPLHPDLGC